jgi:hypothetical protein
MSNLRIWDEVKTTNPAFLKEYKGAGGFSGTAINGHHLIGRATEIFGPCGLGWGYDIVVDRFDQGGPLATPEGMPTVYAVMHTLRIDLWYMADGEKRIVTHYGHTPYITANKFGITTDMEAPKKSLTDAIKKCLSMLGFGADVFLGMIDDIHYVEETKNAFAIEAADNQVDEKIRQAAEFKAWLDNNIRLIETAQSLTELSGLHASATRKLKHRNDDANIIVVSKAATKRKLELTEGEQRETV